MEIFNIQQLFRRGKGKIHYLFLLFTMVTLLTVLPAIGFAQNFASTDEQTTSWGTATDWTGTPDAPTASFLAGNPDVSGSNITIQGTVNTVGSLTISTTVQLVVTSGDTIIINGNLNIVSGGSLSLQVQTGAYFFLLGDFDIQSGAVAITFDVTGGGFFGVRGNYTETVTPTGGLNSDSEYIIGTVTGTHISSSSSSYPSGGPTVVGNRTALIAQASASTRKILLGVQALGASCTVSSPITCNGGTGAITATASGGSYKYQYKLSDGVSPDIYYPNASSYTSDASHIFSGLASKPYTIEIIDDDVPQGTNSCLINLTQPDPLTFSDNGTSKNWSCASASSGVCNGTLNLAITGGTSPYTITGTATNNVPGNNFSSNSALIGSLCADVYTVTVTDVNNCPSTPGTLNYSVSLDNAGPNCSDSPSPELVNAVTYLSSPSVVDTVSNVTFTSTGGIRYVSPVYTVNNSSNRNSLGLQLLAVPSGSSWTNNDTIKVEVSYDNGTTWGAPVIQVVNGGTPANTWIPLNNNQQDIQMRVICVSSSASNYYTVNNLYVRGTNPSKTIVSSGPSGCTDNFAPTLTTTHSDGPVTWYCTTAGSPEFSFNRTWSVFDGCKYTNYNQPIAVGAAPTFTGPAQTYTFDFCHAATQTLNCPTHTDVCDPALIVSYTVIDNQTGNQIGTGNGTPLTNFGFPVPTQNDTTYTVRWTVTDDAGFSASRDETVTILKPMQITLTPVAGDDHFCTGEEVQFNVSVTGGTGAYDVPTFTPASISWNSSDGNVSGLYTTNGLVWISGSGTNIIVDYTDSNNGSVTGGCSTSAPFNNGSGFTVHPNITTNAISRMP